MTLDETDMQRLCHLHTVLLCLNVKLILLLIESMIGLRPRQGNLRLVLRLFSLMRGLPSIR